MIEGSRDRVQKQMTTDRKLPNLHILHICSETFLLFHGEFPHHVFWRIGFFTHLWRMYDDNSMWVSVDISTDDWLVLWLPFGLYFPRNIYREFLIIPTDELVYFSEGWPNHQPDELEHVGFTAPRSILIYLNPCKVQQGGFMWHSWEGWLVVASLPKISENEALLSQAPLGRMFQQFRLWRITFP